METNRLTAQADVLLKSGDKVNARITLMEALSAGEDAAQIWYLMAVASDSNKEKEAFLLKSLESHSDDNQEDEEVDDEYETEHELFDRKKKRKDIFLVGFIIVGLYIASLFFSDKTPNSTSANSNTSNGAYKSPTVTSRPAQPSTPTAKPQPTATSIPLIGTLNTNGNLRSAPTTDAEIITTLNQHSTVTLFSNLKIGDDIWYRINYDDKEGWVSGSLLTVDPTIADTVPDQKLSPDLFKYIPPPATWCEGNQDASFCVYDFRYTEKVGYTVAPKNGRFIAFGIVVQNFSSTDISANPNDFSVEMQDGRTYSYSEVTFSYWSDPLEHTTIASNAKAAGGIVFAVPKDTAIAKIIFRPFLQDTITINLKDEPYKK